jgi:Protein of unknown function (DUF2283)
MKQIYLRVTYRDDGSPFAAYLHLPSESNAKRAKCRRVEPGMILDINEKENLIGIELTAPTLVTLEDINKVLDQYGLEPIKKATLKPLLAA